MIPGSLGGGDDDPAREALQELVRGLSRHLVRLRACLGGAIKVALPRRSGWR